MNTRIFFIAFFGMISTATTSCNKDKPAVGNYQATFYNTSPSEFIQTSTVEITSVTKHHIVINGYEITKSGKTIEGELPIIGIPNSVFQIKGTWSKKAFSQKYTISGTFIEEYWQGGNPYEGSGTFEIVSME